MKVLDERFKLFVKIIISLTICLIYSIPAAFICFYIPRVWAEKVFIRVIRRVGLVILLLLIFSIGILLHFLICYKLMPFNTKKYKVIYWIVSIFFMNPYIWFGIFYLISYIPGTKF